MSTVNTQINVLNEEEQGVLYKDIRKVMFFYFLAPPVCPYALQK